MQKQGYFGDESVTWKVAQEAVLYLGGARAVLMQLAHPLVAMGVSEHSNYLSEPFGRAERTFMLGQMLTFGQRIDAHKAARTINRLHTHVHGTLPAQSGDHAGGTGYSARDPELLLWVHATLVDTALLIYPHFVRKLTTDEEETYYQESKHLARLLNLSSENMPATVADLRRYVHEMVYSSRLAATPQARDLARTVLFPPMPTKFKPLLHFHLLMTCALLPEPVRAIYGLEWGKKRQLAFNVSALGMRMFSRTLPPHLRVLPITRKLMEQHEAL